MTDDVYEPDVLRLVAFAAISFVALGAIGWVLWMVLSLPDDVQVREAVGTGALIGFAAFAALAFSLWRVYEGLRGLPRLTVMDEGVELETLFGTRWAGWESVGAFELIEPSSFWYTPGQYSGIPAAYFRAAATVIGTKVSDNVLAERRFIIPNRFAIDLPALIRALNLRRDWALRNRGTYPANSAGTESMFKHFG